VSVISAVRAPTALTASLRAARQKLTLTAKLTSSGQPLSGQLISFTTGNTLLCGRDTNIAGVATCVLTVAQTRLAERNHDKILARYPGSTNYQPSSATLTPQ
jgi:hypothetical protein